MASGTGPDRPPKKDRREAAREKARIMREEAARRAKRRRWIVQGSVTVVVVAVLAIVALVIVSSIQPAGPGPKNMASGGILLTSTTKAVTTPAQKANTTATPTAQSTSKGIAQITVYLDYQCPYCDQFETANTTQIGQWIDSGIATLEIHPIAILDQSSSGTKYSTRSANAAACVANYTPNVFFTFNTAMFKDQPAEGGTGLTDSKILSIMKGAGASSAALTKCVTDQTFSKWVTASTSAVQKAKVVPNSKVAFAGTPTVLVNGATYSGSLTDASAFLSFVSQSVSASAGTSTSTPTPTPTTTPAG